MHIRAAVNRAWGTSMEIGVRVSKEPARAPHDPTYCCHAYLTFVTRPYTPEPTRLRSILIGAGLAEAPAKVKPLATPVVPGPLIEQKRFLLAGRRRAHRIGKAKGQEALLVRMRRQVEESISRQEHDPEPEDAIEKLQEESELCTASLELAGERDEC